MNPTPANNQNVHQILESVFGYKTFRDNQEAIINRTINGENSLVIMPTGGGKSLCYQVPALVFEGLTLVISPLISLMKDQVEALQANGVEAAALNSSLTEVENNAVIQKIRNGILKLLYVSPEKAVSNSFLNFISKQNVSLIAIDEAHCVSVWGNDFRPEYAKLHLLTSRFSNIAIMALTATADVATRADIVKQLQLENTELFLSSFERENINIEVRAAYKRFQHIVDIIEGSPNSSGIVYCLSRKSTENLAQKLNERGFKAAHYHAQLSPTKRNEVQEAFLLNEIPIICATIAFGMGIDKANVRWVIHYNLPKNVESYYQEIGRAGRDGRPSKAVLFAGFGDVMTFRNMIEDSTANIQFKQVQMQKLNRIWEFSQATNCRTNFILNYFGEITSKPCKHCDNCKNPPRGFDGTLLTQKALSAVKRTQERVGVQLLADVLRGSMRREILDNDFQNIKTFGAGSDLPRTDWLEYITQMINLGYIELDYTQNARLKCTELGNEVLFKAKKVKLTKAKVWQKGEPTAKRKRSKRDEFNIEFLSVLEEARKKVAQAKSINPANVFTDQTLKAMVETCPLFTKTFMEISGVNEIKFKAYGSFFVSVIQQFVANQQILKSVKGSTYVTTYLKYKTGLTPFQIARERSVATDTIFGHLGYLYEQYEAVDIMQFITEAEIEQIKPAYHKFKEEDRPEVAVYLHFREQINRSKIRLAISWIKRNETD
ncbi:UNVERIFIED_CONTAM: hypothetical protein GTU68_059980 [Idotea baltica]|nr:hypothetical protein [Idotea baltica]